MENKFDLAAEFYDAKPEHRERAIKIAEEIIKNTPIGKNWIMADFGCGTGLLGFQFINIVKCIDMIDTSSKMLEKVNEKVEHLNLHNKISTLMMDIEKTDSTYYKYDLIVTSMSFHHIPDIISALSKLKNMIKNDRYLAIADLNEEDGTFHDDGITVHNGINQDFLIKTATDIGLKLHYKSVPYIIYKKRGEGMRGYPVFLHIYRRIK
ncbi:MAG: class I SAM-dependent methyltransferase [Deferribacterales bacterium]